MIGIMQGLEVGASPAQALSNIMVVNGRPSIWGDLAIGIVRRSGLLKSFKEDPPHVALKQGFGRCQVERINGETMTLHNPADYPDPTQIANIAEPWIIAKIIAPDEYLGGILGFLPDQRGGQIGFTDVSGLALVV